ncbi:MAG: tRNA 2'-O-methylase [Methanocella sp. PtaU1.Bin125]|nr:MAG: tRNA 2'-O-methylase [Methanocella sp. PtaU1.Bin125]
MRSKEAFSLLRKYGATDSVLAHIKKVRDYALEIAAGNDCDIELVEAAAILHDIGRTRTHGIDHAIAGAEILRREGVDERIVRIVERHTGAGLTRDEAAYLGLPPADYVPETIEEKIVCHADNLIGNKERITIHDAIRTAREKWSPEALQRLIEMHFEVFRPETVTIDKRLCDDMTIDKAIGRMDVLFKTRPAGAGCIVSVYGHDAKKAVARLKKLSRSSGTS